MNPTESLEYKVKTSVFEGPLDLLLSLIESRKLFINEISLAQVTDDYLTYIKSLPKNDLSLITGFITIASTLILIKSRSLLPGLSLTVDEEEKIVDLETRLKVYAVVKEVSDHIKNAFGKEIIFSANPRAKQKFHEPVFSPDPQITLDGMHQGIFAALRQIPKQETLPEVAIRTVISMEEVLDSLTERITHSMKINFREFSNAAHLTEAKEKKVYVIVTFLAMLELVRQGIVDVVQNNNFDDMEITKQEILEEITDTDTPESLDKEDQEIQITEIDIITQEGDMPPTE